jgi:hypothetical protein
VAQLTVFEPLSPAELRGSPRNAADQVDGSAVMPGAKLPPKTPAVWHCAEVAVTVRVTHTSWLPALNSGNEITP